ncbi:unnamed protein product [Amoebophrya sp. A25]|nr:unnamed protein product [Amoebophrya sp. A25]|eukprot:GSA25T00002828001.1
MYPSFPTAGNAASSTEQKSMMKQEVHIRGQDEQEMDESRCRRIEAKGAGPGKEAEESASSKNSPRMKKSLGCFLDWAFSDMECGDEPDELWLDEPRDWVRRYPFIISGSRLLAGIAFAQGMILVMLSAEQILPRAYSAYLTRVNVIVTFVFYLLLHYRQQRMYRKASSASALAYASVEMQHRYGRKYSLEQGLLAASAQLSLEDGSTGGAEMLNGDSGSNGDKKFQLHGERTCCSGVDDGEVENRGDAEEAVGAPGHDSMSRDTIALRNDFKKRTMANQPVILNGAATGFPMGGTRGDLPRADSLLSNLSSRASPSGFSRRGIKSSSRSSDEEDVEKDQHHGAEGDEEHEQDFLLKVEEVLVEEPRGEVLVEQQESSGTEDTLANYSTLRGPSPVLNSWNSTFEDFKSNSTNRNLERSRKRGEHVFSASSKRASSGCIGTSRGPRRMKGRNNSSMRAEKIRGRRSAIAASEALADDVQEIKVAPDGARFFMQLRLEDHRSALSKVIRLLQEWVIILSCFICLIYWCALFDPAEYDALTGNGYLARKWEQEGIPSLSRVSMENIQEIETLTDLARVVEELTLRTEGVPEWKDHVCARRESRGSSSLVEASSAKPRTSSSSAWGRNRGGLLSSADHGGELLARGAEQLHPTEITSGGSLTLTRSSSNLNVDERPLDRSTGTLLAGSDSWRSDMQCLNHAIEREVEQRTDLIVLRNEITRLLAKRRSLQVAAPLVATGSVTSPTQQQQEQRPTNVGDNPVSSVSPTSAALASQNMDNIASPATSTSPSRGLVLDGPVSPGGVSVGPGRPPSRKEKRARRKAERERAQLVIRRYRKNESTPAYPLALFEAAAQQTSQQSSSATKNGGHVDNASGPQIIDQRNIDTTSHGGSRNTEVNTVPVATTTNSASTTPHATEGTPRPSPSSLTTTVKEAYPLSAKLFELSRRWRQLAFSLTLIEHGAIIFSAITELALVKQRFHLGRLILLTLMLLLYLGCNVFWTLWYGRAVYPDLLDWKKTPQIACCVILCLGLLLFGVYALLAHCHPPRLTFPCTCRKNPKKSIMDSNGDTTKAGEDAALATAESSSKNGDSCERGTSKEDGQV